MLINYNVKYDAADDHLSVIFAALADPTRRVILAKLSKGEATVNELAALSELSLQAISRHLKVLEHAGLISRSKHAQWRPCKLEPSSLKQAYTWMEEYREFWEGNLTSLNTYLQKLQHKEKKS